MVLRTRGFFAAVFFLLVFGANIGSAADTVRVQDFRFVPATLTVQRGGTVVWKVVQQCCLVHTVSRDNEPMSWDSGPVPLGGTFQITFPSTGNFSYFCTSHLGLGMAGSINVVNPPPSTVPATGWLGLLLLGASLTAAGIWILERKRKTA